MERSIIRMFAGVLSGAAVLQFVFLLPVILSEVPAFTPAGALTVALAVFVPLVAMGIAACFPSVRLVRWCMTIAVVSGVGVLAGLPFIRVEDAEPMVPWPSLIAALYPTLAASLWNARVVIAVGALTVAFDSYSRSVFDPIGFSEQWLDILQVLVIYCLVFCTVTLLVRRSAARVDEARETLQREIAETSTRAAVEREQVRLDGMVHDEVLAVLVSAAKAKADDMERPEFREALASGARRASQVLRQQRDAGPGEATGKGALSEGTDVPVSRLVRRIHEHFPSSVRTVLSVTADASASLPGPVAGVLELATAEALQNVERHSRAKNCWVSVSAGPGAEIRVIDNGAGFAPERAGVDDNRMGIRVSIVGRMRSVDGGDAWIESAPMFGTTVVMQWQPSA